MIEVDIIACNGKPSKNLNSVKKKQDNPLLATVLIKSFQ